MKLLHIRTARVIWLFDVNDLNPKGQSLVPKGIDAIAARYNFLGVPSPASIAESQKKNEPTEFNQGTFKSEEGFNILLDLKIYRDGAIVESRSSTKEGERFLRDILDWMPEGVGLPEVNVPIRKKMYVSELVFEASHPLALINPKLASLGKMLASAVPPRSPVSYEEFGISMATDPKDGPPLTNFRLERETSVNYEEKRYFSAAPVHTNDHLILLSKIEKALRS